MRLFSVAMTAAAIAFATAMAGPASAQGKTVKACQEEWRANKADFKAKGISEKAYVAQCRGGAATAQPAPTATPPGGAPAPTPSGTAKTAKACRDEWRANRDSYKAAHVSEKAYVEKCQAGQTVALPAAPPAATPPATTTAAPPTTPTPEPAPAPRLSARTAVPTATGAGEFATEAQAKSSCVADIVVWANLTSRIYHFAGHKNYGNTKRGAYMCEKQAIAQGFRASKTEKRPGV